MPNSKTANQNPLAPQVGTCYCLTDVEKNTWEEVVCYYKMTKSLLDKVNDALEGKGYTVDSNHIPNEDGDGRFQLSKISKESLKAFQLKNNCHQGSLNIKTLKLLGITYQK